MLHTAEPIPGQPLESLGPPTSDFFFCQPSEQLDRFQFVGFVPRREPATKSDNRRKSKGRTPKRRTPGRRKTPGSSAKKRTLSLPVAKQSQTLSREAPKRALFQSPPDEPAPKASHPSPAVSRTASNKTQKLKRVLFSPPVKRRLALPSSNGAKTGPSNNVTSASCDSSGIKNLSTGESVDLNCGEPSRKRKRPTDEADEDSLVQKQKMSRTEPVKEADLTPRSSKLLRSQSFCLGSQSKSNRSALDSSSRNGKTLVRANSESVTLTENHRKKLLWAVSQALQTKQISMKHENFRKYASILAHVVKKLFLEFNDHSVSSTSEKMLRLAHKHLFDVLQGQSSEEIYQRERTRLLNAKNILRPHGYISPEEYEQAKLRRSRSASVFVLDNSNDSSFGAGSSSQPPAPVPLSQCSSVFSQSSEFLNGLSQSSSFHGSQSAMASDSAKNTILRENIDSEQRQKSSQKQISFSGKDQKNMSPYADAKSGSQAKTKLLVGGSVGSSILKAKRQISFE
ncbi:AAEL010024-PA [Aedes aegypti]|uniref:AAEL010024-PA n=1 Tax=Aedes aegypti TaxID=7159 RepID=Q16U32_AEDAE|nr:AAEL010024-PA [Aedes aegypti]